MGDDLKRLRREIMVLVRDLSAEKDKNAGLIARVEEAERQRDEAVEIERKRCAQIVLAARMGEVDHDFRSIGHMILGGRSIEEIKDILK